MLPARMPRMPTILHRFMDITDTVMALHTMVITVGEGTVIVDITGEEDMDIMAADIAGRGWSNP
jgi:hypothetical protein